MKVSNNLWSVGVHAAAGVLGFFLFGCALEVGPERGAGRGAQPQRSTPELLLYSTASHDGVQGDFVVGADRELIESRTWTYGLFRIGNLRDGDRRLQVDVRISGVGSESGDAFYVIEPFRSSHRLDGSDWGFVALPSLPGRYCLRFEVKDELGAIETVLYRRFARLPGDINGDGKVESRDLNSVQAYFRVDGAPSDFSFRSDVDVNGMVDPDDTSVIRQGVTRNLNLGRISPPDCGGSGEPR